MGDIQLVLNTAGTEAAVRHCWKAHLGRSWRVVDFLCCFLFRSSYFGRVDSRISSSLGIPYSLLCGCRRRAKPLLIRHFLAFGLVLCVAGALAWPVPGNAVHSVTIGSFRVMQTVNISTIFLLAGLVLHTEEIKDAFRHFPALLLGTISILFISPCAAFILGRIHFHPIVYTYGW
jgi:hypothetical protein